MKNNFNEVNINKLKNLWHEWKIIALIIFITFSTLIYFAFQNINIGFLQLHSIDEYAFQGSLQHMAESILSGDISGLFGYSFYQYGFAYFFINLLVALPGILTDNFIWAISAPRIVTSFFAIGSLIYIYKLARLFIGIVPATLFTTIFITMPAFWFNATWFHPDWAMTFFLIGFVYYLAKDNWRFDKNFKLAILFYGLAVAFKYQAITVIPLLGLYIFYDSIRTLNLSSVILPIKRFITSLGAILLIFIICNPYILHPMGWQAFTGAFLSNMESNITNHGANTIVSLVDKINFAVTDYYTNIIFLFIFILASLWLTWQYIKNSERNLFSIIAINFLINLGYLLFFVNKAWQIYYLPVMVLGLLSLIYILRLINDYHQKLVLGFAIICQIVIYSTSYYPILTISREAKANDYSTYTTLENKELDNFIVNSLDGFVNNETSIIITAYTPFSFNELNLRYEQIKPIFGALNRSSFDSKSYLTEQKNYWGELKTDDELLQSFKPADIIILRKDIPFMNKNMRINSQQNTSDDSTKIVESLYDNTMGYYVLAEDNLVVIFRKNNL